MSTIEVEDPVRLALTINPQISARHSAVGTAGDAIVADLQAALARLITAFNDKVEPLDSLIADIETRVREIGGLYSETDGHPSTIRKCARTLRLTLEGDTILTNELLVLLSQGKVEEAVAKAVAPIDTIRAQHEDTVCAQADQVQSRAQAQLELLVTGPVVAPMAPGTGSTSWVADPDILVPKPTAPRPRRDRTRISPRSSRRRAPRRSTGRVRRRLTIGGAIIAAIVIAAMVMSNGPSWPPIVPQLQNEVRVACGQANTSANGVTFACDSQTQQIMWVLSLVTSRGNVGYNGDTWSALVAANSPKAAKIRVGLEPIYTIEGAQMFQLLLKSMQSPQPYNPLNANQSILVAAQAINNMIAGGYGVDPKTGGPEVFPGFMQYSKACLAYTGSAAQTWRDGLPECKNPIEPSGYPALVRDIAAQWIPGGSPALVQDALILFEHASDPGNPQVRSVLKQLHLLT